jgi:hypothetical protein
MLRLAGVDMTTHNPESASERLIDVPNMTPPRDPDDEEDEDENSDDESEDDEPAGIREPDDE